MDFDIFETEDFAKDTNFVQNFKEYNISGDDFLNKTTILYGTSGSGKSYLLKNILYELRTKIPRVVLISDIADLNGDYKNIIHHCATIPDLNENIFVSLMNEQNKIVQLYKKVNDKKNLYEVYRLCPTNNEYNHIEQMRQQAIMQISNEKEDEGIIAKKMFDLNEKLDKKLIEYLKTYICQHREKFTVEILEKLSPDAQDCLKYIDLNPNTLFIFEDKQQELKELATKKNSAGGIAFKNIFTKGRHSYITALITLQGDGEIAPMLRKNARISIFTSRDEFISFLTRATNSIDKKIKELGLKLAEQIFQSKEDHRKVIYFKDRPIEEIFMYLIAQEKGLFCVGSKIFNEYCDFIKKEN